MSIQIMTHILHVSSRTPELKTFTEEVECVANRMRGRRKEEELQPQQEKEHRKRREEDEYVIQRLER